MLSGLCSRCGNGKCVIVVIRLEKFSTTRAEADSWRELRRASCELVDVVSDFQSNFGNVFVRGKEQNPDKNGLMVFVCLAGQDLG